LDRHDEIEDLIEYIDEGLLRKRTFDRYLRLEQLQKIPRWRRGANNLFRSLKSDD